MPISFNQIPSNVRVPLVYIEFDNTRAVQGTPQFMRKILVIGQRLAAGTVAAGVIKRVTNDAQPEDFFGRGSMLAEMLHALRKANRFTETWAVALDDNGAGVAAAGSITVTGPATEAGTISLYIAGKLVEVAVATAAAQNAIATAIAAAVNANTSLPVTAVVDGVILNKVNITARHKGLVGNDIDIRVNYQQHEKTPNGVALAIVAMAGGTTAPDLAPAIAAMGAEWWNWLVVPYTDAASLTAIEAELLDRWGPTRMIDGRAFIGFRGTHAASATFGAGRNSFNVTCMGTSIAPQPPYIWAAAYAGIAAASLSIDPARPLQTLALPGILAPAIADRWTLEERNLLLFDGIATWVLDPGGNVLIEREVTTYQENSFSIDDPSYLDLTTPETLSYIRFAVRARITQKFPRYKLADDGTRFGPGQAIVTPRIIHAELVALMRELEEQGLVENVDTFAEQLIVERNASDVNRIDVLAPPDLVNQFRILAMQTQFIL